MFEVYLLTIAHATIVADIYKKTDNLAGTHDRDPRRCCGWPDGQWRATASPLRARHATATAHSPSPRTRLRLKMNFQFLRQTKTEKGTHAEQKPCEVPPQEMHVLGKAW
jgi:hypothetical protein